MKAMVLAAGLGTRMRPLTLLRAKPVLPVLNRPLLHWTLERLARAGVTEAVVNLHHLPGTVRRAVGDGHAFGLRVRFAFEKRILGTGGGPRAARRWLGDEPILLVNGDVLFDFDLARLIARHRRAAAAATLALLPNPDRRRYSAVLTDRDGRIRTFRGGPRSRSAGLFAGVHVLDPGLLDRLPAGPSDVVRDLYVPLLAEGRRVQGVRVRGAWYDFGNLPSYIASQLSMLASGFQGMGRRTVLVGAGARIARGARAIRSVVGAGVVLEEGSEIVDSVLWDGVRVGRGARLERSILATGARVRAGAVVKGRLVLRRRGRQRSVSIE
jgi:NDP-sugar pyrophosphorylase family protein